MKKSSTFRHNILTLIQFINIILFIYSLIKYFATNNYLYIYLVTFFMFTFGMTLLYYALGNNETDYNNYIYLTKEEYDKLNNKINIDEKVIKEKNKRIKELKNIIDKVKD